jgi:hypothetical protein
MDVDLDVGGLDMPDYPIQSNPFGALLRRVRSRIEKLIALLESDM